MVWSPPFNKWRILVESEELTKDCQHHRHPTDPFRNIKEKSTALNLLCQFSPMASSFTPIEAFTQEARFAS
jgi:hypothetical protein